jgi:hypothetical protein
MIFAPNFLFAAGVFRPAKSCLCPPPAYPEVAAAAKSMELGVVVVSKLLTIKVYAKDRVVIASLTVLGILYIYMRY